MTLSLRTAQAHANAHAQAQAEAEVQAQSLAVQAQAHATAQAHAEQAASRLKKVASMNASQFAGASGPTGLVQSWAYLEPRMGACRARPAAHNLAPCELQPAHDSFAFRTPVMPSSGDVC
jgi:hypothetical protein